MTPTLRIHPVNVELSGIFLTKEKWVELRFCIKLIFLTEVQLTKMNVTLGLGAQHSDGTPFHAKLCSLQMWLPSTLGGNLRSLCWKDFHVWPQFFIIRSLRVKYKFDLHLSLSLDLTLFFSFQVPDSGWLNHVSAECCCRFPPKEARDAPVEACYLLGRERKTSFSRDDKMSPRIWLWRQDSWGVRQKFMQVERPSTNTRGTAPHWRYDW